MKQGQWMQIQRDTNKHTKVKDIQQPAPIAIEPFIHKRAKTNEK